MVGREITATEIGKHSQLIKAAQEEMSAIDVLVCGRCLTVCHFVEDFVQHKQTPCSKENNNIRECNDTKPKVWAFLLWKATQLHNNKNNGATSPNSWTLYQTWVKMDESLRDTWVMAGRTIQSFSKVGQGGLQEMPVKITKTIVNNNNTNTTGTGAVTGSGGGDGTTRKPLTQTKPQVTNVKSMTMSKTPTPVAVVAAAAQKTAIAADIENEATSANKATVGSGGTVSIGANSGNSAAAQQHSPTNTIPKLLKKSPMQAAGLASPIQSKVNTVNLQSSKASPAQSRRATRSSPNSDELLQENVEKIVAKRFNPRRKMHEYLVKWDGRPHDQNTWEPMSHLEHVTHLLDVFEKQLARQKENRAALQAKQSGGSQSPVPVGVGVKNLDVNKKSPTTENAGQKVLTKSGSQIVQGKAAPSSSAVSVSVSGGSSNNNLANSISTTPNVVDKSAENSPTARPTRTSKMKAMDQVKQWVSNDANVVLSSAISNADINMSGNSLNSSGGSIGSGVNVSVGSTLKRKFNDSIEDLSDLNVSDTPSATASTMEDLEEDLIPSHTVKRMKNGTGVSVESKTVRVNGTNTRGNTTTFSGESIPVGPKSADVIITKDKGVSGVVRKPGFTGSIKANCQKPEAQIRILSKEESAVMTTGIVRTSSGGLGGTKSSPITPISQNSNDSNTTTPRQQQQQQVRLTSGGGGVNSNSGGRHTPTVTSSSSSSASASTPTPGSNHSSSGSGGINPVRQQIVQRTSSGTIIQRKTLTPGQRTSGSGTVGMRSGGGGSQFSSSGRMVIPRSASGQITHTRGGMTVGSGGKVITPEQKILQLSKSGDLKVTKKMMTREDAVAHRLSTQQQRLQHLQRQQQHQQQQQQQQQSQVQIQKVQQLAPANTTRSVSSVSVRKRADGTYAAHDEQTQSTLCPITGKILGQEEQPSSQQLQNQMLTAAAAAEQQHQQQLALQEQQQQQHVQQQQQQQENQDQTLMLTSDQLLTNEDGTPLLVTGEDGTVYQVAGKNAEGQTILVTQGPDGEQQFAYVATTESEDNQVLTLDNAVAEAVAQLPAEQQAEALAAATSSGGNQYLVKTTQEDGTTHMVAMTEAELQQHQALMQQQISISEDNNSNNNSTTTSAAAAVAAGSTSSVTESALNQLCIQTGEGADGQEANIPAEVVQAELPSPGGTRRVVLLLQDGTFMMTEMQDDEFKALNIAA